jgi:hypothetical protein
MMYGVVAQALRDVGKLDIEHPCDYLNFYCLGNRETETQTEKEHPAPNPPDEASKHVSMLLYILILQLSHFSFMSFWAYSTSCLPNFFVG